MRPGITMGRATGARRARHVLAITTAVLTAFVVGCADDPTATERAGDLAPLHGDPLAAHDDRYVIMLTEAAPSVEETAAEIAGLYGAELVHVYSEELRSFAIRLDPDALMALRQHPDVAGVIIDAPIRMPKFTRAENPVDLGPAGVSGSQSSAPEHLRRIDTRNPSDMNSSYTYNETGAGVHVYILDSGIRATHTDFSGRATLDQDYHGYPSPDCIGHGTAVAGIVGGEYAGVAKDVTIHAVRITTDCDDQIIPGDVIAALDWVRTSTTARPAVVNISANLAGLSDPQRYNLGVAVTALVNSGVGVVGSAGNINQDGMTWNCSSPGNAADALSVSGFKTYAGGTVTHPNPFDIALWQSCTNGDIWAPWTAPAPVHTANTGFLPFQGTSAAAPQVAGVAALYLERRPTASWATVRAAIINGSTPNLLQEEYPEDMTVTSNRIVYSRITSVLWDVNMSGPASPSYGSQVGYSAYISGNTTGPFTYVWHERPSGSSTWTQKATTQSYNRTIGNPEGAFDVRVIATKGTVKDTTTMTVTPTTPPPLLAGIGGNASMTPHLTCDFVGGASGGLPPYSFTWSLTGKASMTPLTGETTTVTAGLMSFTLHVTVTSADNQTAQASRFVTVSSSGSSACVM